MSTKEKPDTTAHQSMAASRTTSGKRMRALGCAALAVSLALGATRPTTPRADTNEWWLYSEVRILPETIAPGTWYRLGNASSGGTLQWRQGSNPPGLSWGRVDAQKGISEGTRNVRVHRLVHDPDAGEFANVGRYVRLDELVALEVQGKGFLVYRKTADGPKLAWTRERRYSAHTHPGVYQWKFQTGGNIRDHRQRAIVTKERLVLFNTVNDRSLVHDARNGHAVGWRK